ncbi:hypothetical protein [Curtobacterium ammoniigenes]|uniref:hypothetical protein n=1 Tax=Curtobacterium ammoniigenes TaxID=395387 RepID=UPI0008328651|nr:hypothetical protein [Curtobacterium ammoniigenes]
MTGFADDAIAIGTTDVPDGWFDRFIVNLHPADASAPTLHIGGGVYPARGVADGFVLAVLDGEQRNLRLSTTLADVRETASRSVPGGNPAAQVGSLHWTTVVPMRHWQVRLDDNPSGVRFELDWHRRLDPWSAPLTVHRDAEETARFDHLVQSGMVSGRIDIDGHRVDVSGWPSARDRSRGTRTLHGGHGLHLWVVAHFPTCSVAALHVIGRDGHAVLTDGGIVHADGRIDDIVDVRHNLRFDALQDLVGGSLAVTTASGLTLQLDATVGMRGGYMSGGGYGGAHGADRGRAHVEADVYPLDGSVGPRLLDTPLTDRAVRFTGRHADGTAVAGSGIIEFAQTRSARYAYRATLEPKADALVPKADALEPKADALEPSDKQSAAPSGGA